MSSKPLLKTELHFTMTSKQINSKLSKRVTPTIHQARADEYLTDPK